MSRESGRTAKAAKKTSNLPIETKEPEGEGEGRGRKHFKEEIKKKKILTLGTHSSSVTGALKLCFGCTGDLLIRGHGEPVRLDRSLSSRFAQIPRICLPGERVVKVFLKCTYPSGGKARWDCWAGFFWRVPSLWSSCSGVEGRFSGEVGMCRNSALWAQSHKPSKTATASPKTSNDLHLHLSLTQFLQHF